MLPSQTRPLLGKVAAEKVHFCSHHPQTRACQTGSQVPARLSGPPIAIVYDESDSIRGMPVLFEDWLVGMRSLSQGALQETRMTGQMFVGTLHKLMQRRLGLSLATACDHMLSAVHSSNPEMQAVIQDLLGTGERPGPGLLADTCSELLCDGVVTLMTTKAGGEYLVISSPLLAQALQQTALRSLTDLPDMPLLPRSPPAREVGEYLVENGISMFQSGRLLQPQVQTMKGEQILEYALQHEMSRGLHIVSRSALLLHSLKLKLVVERPKPGQKPRKDPRTRKRAESQKQLQRAMEGFAAWPDKQPDNVIFVDVLLDLEYERALIQYMDRPNAVKDVAMREVPNFFTVTNPAVQPIPRRSMSMAALWLAHMSATSAIQQNVCFKEHSWTCGTIEQRRRMPCEPASHASADDWKQALDTVVPCCLVLKITQARAFDTEAAGSSYATGFIVDKKRGLILTNRHVVTPGPITAEAIFLNHEEVPVYPLYYDPIHDFGFLRFDPSKLQFMAVGEVPLAPEAAAVGMEVRVIGNDSGEKVSILAGTLARLDRDAPHYSRTGYNDFNTFYLQAASGTKGGSSGSPVIDSKGRVVALNAGGKNKAASAYYLPLERVVRALKLLQAGKDWQAAKDPSAGPDRWPQPQIPRGDFQATFVFKGFEEVRRLGLTHQTEAVVRAAAAQEASEAEGIATGPPTGMLVVDSIVPGGPADGALEPGDALIKLDGRCICHFLPMEALLDDHVGRTVEVEVERGGVHITARIQVQDLHAVTPSSMLEIAGASIHALSYQQARNHRAQVGQVYIAETGYLFGRAAVPKYAILTSLAGQATPDLETFARVLRSQAAGARVPLHFLVFGERNRKRTALLHVDRNWYGPALYWTRDHAAGLWHATANWPAGDVQRSVSAAPQPAPSAAAEPDGQLPQILVDAEAEEHVVDPLEDKLKRCLVLIEVDIPLVALADGVHSRSFTGNGVVVHHSSTLGLVVVDRNTVAIGAGDIMLSFGAHPAEVSARVRFLHPLHNFAIVSYNPKDLSPEAREMVRAAELLATPALHSGDSVRLAGLTKELRLMRRQSQVINACASLAINCIEVPRFRAVHEEVIKVDHDFGATFSGVLTDEEGRVRALWGSYSEQVEREEREWCAGLPTSVFQPYVEQLSGANLESPGCRAVPPRVRVLDAELEPVLLSKAAQFGMPAEWVARLARLDPLRRQVLRVRSCVAGSHAAAVLQGGDIVLAAAGQPVSHFRGMEDIIASYQQPASGRAGAPLQELPSSAGQTNDNAGADLEVSPRKRSRPVKGQPPPASPKKSRSVEEAATPADDLAMQALPAIPLTICRNARVEEVSVRLGLECGLGTDRLVHWCGAQLQAPHRAVREMGFLPEPCNGVYVSRWHHGSPAHRYGLYALHWITQVNGIAVPDLDAFLGVAKMLQDKAFVRLKLIHLETGKPKVLTLKQDLRYWPTWELRQDTTAAAWKRIVWVRSPDLAHLPDSVEGETTHMATL
ncbi:hypothetical protein WJX72_004724 [[Myrmecia] bisecta]|uniref:PDZ domain-containing protein n=1 Tax=[Myrmecia] bisecta TaxID=41462 RepID=A0AAW1Q769_9CHLO